MRQRALPRLARWLALLGVIAAALFAAPAWADDTEQLSAARAKFQQANELEQAGNWAGALRLFREVGQVRMTPQVRFHIAVCEENLGKLAVALGGYELAQQGADTVGPEFTATVSEKIESLRARIPKLLIERGTGAAAAVVELDGVALGASSIGKEVPVDPGPHSVSARAPGKAPFEATLEIAERETKTLRIDLEPLAAPAGPEVAPTASIPETPPDPPPPRKSRLLPYVLGGVGVASLASSGVFFLLQNGAVGELEDACGPDRNRCPSSSESTYDRARTYNTLSRITLGVGIAALGTAAVLIFTEKREPAQQASLSVGLGAPGSAAGASVHGSF